MAEMTGQQIYDNFQNGFGPEGLATCAAMAKRISDNYRMRMLDIQQLVAEMESAWQGPASEGARAGAGPLLREHASAGEQFGVAEDLTDRQSGSFSRAKHSVVPVPPAPEGVIPWGPMDPGWLPYLQRLKDHGDAAQHNVDVMNDYSGASAYNTENLPARYGEMAVDQSGIAVGGGDTIDSESFRHAGDSGPRPGGGEPGDGEPGGGEPGSGEFGAAEFGPRGSSPVGGTSGESGSGQSHGGTVPAEVTAPGGYSPAPAPLPSGDVARGPAGFAGFGVPGPGGGGGFSSEGRVPGGGGPRAAAEPRTAGPRVGGAVPRGFGLGSGASQEVLSGGRGTARGVHGIPLPAGRARDEDDQEYRVPTYLEGGDPESLFGSAVLTAPPVIGEDDD